MKLSFLHSVCPRWLCPCLNSIQLIRQKTGTAGRAMRLGQGMATGGRERPGVQLGLQDFNHFLLFLKFPAEPGGEKDEQQIKPSNLD
jgi:hypothetical protein